MRIKQKIVQMICLWLALGAFMAVCSPDKLPVVVLIVPFVLLYAAFYSTWNLGIALRARFFVRTQPILLHRPLGMALSLSTVLLIVLQSIGQLTLRDAVTVLAVVVIGYLYVTRSRFVIPKK